MGHYFENDDSLKSRIQKITIPFLNKEFQFYTDNGVFSKNGLDYGTKLLLETIIKLDLNGSILDLGCGYGPIGILLNHFLQLPVTMIDVNERAILLAKKNIVLNKGNNIEALVSDGYQKITRKYQFIISNPPIRVGKSKLYNLISDAKTHLLEDGIIFLVIRKEQGAKSFIKDFQSIYQIELLNKSKGFYIISLKLY